MIRSGCLLSLLAVGSLAHAQDDRRNCSKEYTEQAFRGAMSQAEEALDNVDMNTAVNILSDAGKDLICLDVAVKPTDIARFARNLSVLAFYGQDEFAAIKYGNLARIADPSGGLPRGVTEDHPYASMMEMEDLPPTGGPIDPTLEFPRGGGFFMNGQSKTEARAPAEVPQFVQVFGEHDTVIDAFWQDGAAFPDRYLAGGVGGKGSGPNLVLVGAGGGAVAVGAILYVAAAASAGKMKNAESAEDLTKIRTSANLLVMTSTVVTAAGLGIGASGFLLDGGGGVGVRLQF